MGILNIDTLAGFTNQREALTGAVNFWQDGTRLAAEYSGKQFFFETAFSLEKAQELAAAAEGEEVDGITALQPVCANVEELRGLPAAVASHIMQAYYEAVSAAQGIELGESLEQDAH